MKYIVNILLVLISGACIGTAAYFLYNHVENWGWFLFAAIVILGKLALENYSIVVEEENEQDD